MKSDTPGKNPVPVMVIVVGVLAGKEAGLTDEIGGTTVGWVIAKGSGAEGPPPGVGLVTVTCATPGVLISAVEIVAVTFCGKEGLNELETTVASGTPLNLRTELVAQFKQETVRIKGTEPAMSVVGFKTPSRGTGYVPTFTGKFTVLEGPTVGWGFEAYT